MTREPPMLPTVITPTEPLAPHEQRPDEPLEAWILFLRWTFGGKPRPEIINDAVRQMALRHDWQRRAALVDRRLERVRSVSDTAQQIALDAVSILSTELEALAAESRIRPGRQRLRDLTALLGLVSAMGGFAAIKAPDTSEAEAIDYSTLTEDELATLAEASAILARAKRAPR